ncbi:MAG: hypothetical protein V2A61_04310 [Calditrichota bacterium]
MGSHRKLTTIFITGLFAASLLTAGGCAKWASPDDMQKLEAARKSVQSAEKELKDLQAERSKLEKTKQAKQQELDEANAELAKIKAQ